MRLLGKIVIGAFAAIGCAAIGLASLWLAARPVLETAHASYTALPAAAQCEGPYAAPPGYPRSARAIESDHATELAVYHAACDESGLARSCFYLNGAPRSFGFKLYRRAYLSDCELRAANLHGDTPLRRSLELLYPDRPVASLSEEELTCVAYAMRGHRGFCGRHPECCPAAPQE